jgi:heme/copper-type cytochrome/quinol oxidase subunit 2
MWFAKKHSPEEHRYYLLPGQGRSNRRKRRQHLVVALITGAIFAAVIGTIMWFMNDLR